MVVRIFFKHWIKVFSFAFFCMLVSFINFQGMAQTNYLRAWGRVDSLKNIGQVKTALEEVKSIYDKSKADGLQDQNIRALLYRIILESSFEEKSEEKAIAFATEELRTSGSPRKQILYSIIAEVYWHYYQNNRWEINDRTTVANDTATDISVWDARRFVETCTRYYTLSVSEGQNLKSISLAQFEGIIQMKKDSRKFRPTLYDFLAFRAIDFFTNESVFPESSSFGSGAAARELFAPAADFIRLSFFADNQSSFEHQALRLYQEVLRFHLVETPDVPARIDADLARLAFAYRISTRSDKSQLYIQSLRLLAEKYKDLPVSSDIFYQLAFQLKTEGSEYKPGISEDHKWEIKEALTLAEKTARLFPQTDGGKNCLVLASGIRQPWLQITGNDAAIPRQSSLALVEYKNINTLYVRIVKVSTNTGSDEDFRNGQDILKGYLRIKPVQGWSVKMPSDGDYQLHSAEINIPALQPGQYVLLTSVTPDFKPDSLITFYPFQSTNISLITRWNSNPADILVLNRKDGQPMARVTVRKYYREYDYNKKKTISQPGGSFTSDENGYVRFNSSQTGWNKSFYLVLSAGDDQLVTENYYQGYREEKAAGPEIRTWFFTDRVIYRPGQTIYYKGIVTEKRANKTEIKSGFRSTVRFFDVNDQEISKQEVVTNEFGSFTGSFVAPLSSLTGSFSIRDEHGAIDIQVEEYKRPKFETVFNPVKGSFKLGEMVTVTGKAMAYAGNPITEGSVTYRVKRNARFPWIWWGWRNHQPSVAEMEITNGKTTTNGQGEFSIQFNAIPDLSVSKKFSPFFDYSVIADVSDINGETHSAQTVVSVGYQALIVTTDLADEINAANGLDFTLQTNNLNGQPEKASGLLTIHRIEKPAVLLFARKWKKPDKFTMTQNEFEKSFPEEVYDSEDDISTWSKKEKVLERSFSTPSDSLIRVPSNPGSGFYKLEIRTKDSFGEEVVYQKYFEVFLPETGNASMISPLAVIILKKEAEPGETVPVLLSSPLRNVHAVFEITSINGETKRTSYKLNNQQLRIDLPVLEEHRGNIGIHVTFVKNNRVFQEHRLIRVPYTNKELEISTGSFRDKLEPGQEEEWRITIRDKQGHKTVAELMASMYDASLDAFIRRPWVFSLFNYFGDFSPWNADTGFGTVNGTTWWYPHDQGSFIQKEYERIIDFGFNGYAGGRRLKYSLNAIAPAMAMKAEAQAEVSEDQVFAVAEEMPEFIGEKSDRTGNKGQTDSPMPLPSKPRTDFKETAFFFPQLTTNANGETIIKFKMPESLTRWRFTGLAHTRDLKTGMIERTLITQKDLMIFPNPPRFLREGDHMQFTVKISNISESSLKGKTELHFFDAFTMKSIDDQMSISNSVKDFAVAKGVSLTVGWDISVPAGLQAVVYRITAAAGSFSDGEEAALPVLSNRMLVTESMSLPVRANTTKSFNFKKLANSAQSNTLQNYRLTLEYTSNPAWYAVQALPYLMEFPHECAEQIFSRYYANTLASHIANSDPKVRQVFNAWKNKTPDALKSNLEKNEELKAVLLQESPWVREATGENERKQRVGLLFDLNRMADEQKTALKKLADIQTVNGGWPWFPGMRESEYITQHIVTGLGHLVHLKAVNKEKQADLFRLLEKAVGFLDHEKLKEFQELKKLNSDYLKTNHFDYQTIQYFYARSFFQEVIPFDKSLNEMVAYYKSQAVQYWNGLNNYMRAMTALFLTRMGDKKTASLIMRSLTETALHSDEQGMYWKNNPRGWFWYQAPIETQALLIEAFEEVSGDLKSVDELKVWLLMQKQTQDWKTTKATSEAIYALLLRGSSLLSSDQQVKVTVGGIQVNPYLSNITRPEPGTGYFKTSWNTPEITPEKGRITVSNSNNTVAWGAMYWQYFEQIDKITKAETPLKLAKNLFVEVNSPSGPVLKAISNTRTIKVGDKIVVRVILSADRDMEYIHLKDMRASAFEPVNVLSGYRWNGGLGYYESTRDAATNFFIDYLPKGTYVFEYRLHATQKGEFSNGITSVQCMYAPEFAAHSEGIRVKVE